MEFLIFMIISTISAATVFALRLIKIKYGSKAFYLVGIIAIIIIMIIAVMIYNNSGYDSSECL